MAQSSKAIEAIRESRPPATDNFTYLTIIGEYASPEILPTLQEVLEDQRLTQEIGWDLVQTLAPIPGSEACLETIARLGNPREVILSVLAVLAGLAPRHATDGDEDDPDADEGFDEPKHPTDEGAQAPDRFITLLGMLAILHKRLKVKRPSRFLASTLQTVLQSYDPSYPQTTAAIIHLVHSLSGRRRPTLPTRKSSMSISGVLDPDRDGDTSKNAPDPEADDKDAIDPGEDEIQRRLLLSFVTCVLEAYANANSLDWSPRLLEYYNPKMQVPHRKTALQAFREDEELLGRDAIVGQLVALSRDLGLSSSSKAFLEDVSSGPIRQDPLADTEDGVSSPEDIALSSGGSVCLLAYWLFSTTVFGADNPKPELAVFPQHFSMLERFLEDDAQGEINSNPGTIDAIVAIGLWLVHEDRILPPPSESLSRRSSTAQEEDAVANFMNYHHLLTLNAVYHPSLQVRNAATSLAGLILHADPDVNNRLKILDDLLENCMFGSLKACAVTWLREELVSAAAAAAGDAPSSSSPFRGPDALEAVQYAVFPNLASLRDMDAPALAEWWAQSAAFVLQGVNFAFFLLCDGGAYAHVVPQGLAAAVETRYLEPLAAAARALGGVVRKGEEAGSGAAAGGIRQHENLELALEVDVLRDRLARLSSTEKFRGLAVGLGEDAAGREKQAS